MRPFLNFSETDSQLSTVDAAIDAVTIEECLLLLPTPFYVTSLNAVKQRIIAYQNALVRYFKKSKIHYAVKANFSQEVLAEVLKSGAGLDIVSPGELRAAQRAFCPAKSVCYAGVGKRKKDLIEALEFNVGKINVEHILELKDVLDLILEMKRLAKVAPPTTDILIRWNPCLEIDTHPHLKTGSLDSKFGILASEILSFVRCLKSELSDADFVEYTAPIAGLHVHLGSQVQNSEVYGILCQELVSFSFELVNCGLKIRTFDLGGGLGVGLKGVPENAADIEKHVSFVCGHLASALLKEQEQHPTKLAFWGKDLAEVQVALEPGRSVVSSSSVFVSEVLYSKSNSPSNCFLYIDAGMNDFPRPSLYNAEHALTNLARPAVVQPPSEDLKWNGKNEQKCHVVGPVCESADVLAKSVSLPKLPRGAIICFFEAGAYCRSMASHYNLRPLPAEIYVRDGEIVSWCAEIWP
jgi:diaminopimelate decarboxylase